MIKCTNLNRGTLPHVRAHVVHGNMEYSHPDWTTEHFHHLESHMVSIHMQSRAPGKPCNFISQDELCWFQNFI